MTKEGKSALDAGVSKRRMKSEGRSNEAIAERLEIIRAVKGLSQKEFANAAGVNESTYSQYKKGIQAPNLEQANKLCDTWGLTLDWIYRGDNSGLDGDLRDAIKVIRQARSTKPRKSSVN
ncbi:protein of unknown function [Hyphomicrobium sp. 1Nfss2.1]|uniref:helix-turn-helix domain-containing protein n=1 Tax=Hyphomicrobium sp. 1Nfss2.1 TaxID=3413936 RepID=UPI003C7AB86B